MKPQKFEKQFETIYRLAVRLSEADDADALLVMLDGPTNWEKLRECANDEKIVVVADHEDELAGAEEASFKRYASQAAPIATPSLVAMPSLTAI